MVVVPHLSESAVAVILSRRGPRPPRFWKPLRHHCFMVPLCTYADPLILHLHTGRVGRVHHFLKYASYPSNYIYKSCCYP